MYTCVKFTESMRREWDRFALSQGTIFHTIAFRDILIKSFSYRCGYHAIIDRQGRICALIPLVIGRNLYLKNAAVSLPFINYLDLCVDDDEALRFALTSIKSLKTKYQLDYVELRLKNQFIEDPEWVVQLQNFTFILPLEQDEQKVLSLSSSSNRNHTRKAYKNNWFTVSFDRKHLETFYTIYVRRMKELGSPAPDIRFLQYIFDYLPEYAYLLTVLDRETETVIGGMILIGSPGNSTLYYPYGANLVSYNGKYLNNYMYWEAVRFGIRNGLKFLDLGRSQAGSGTFRYKEQWGAQSEQLKYFSYSGSPQTAGVPNRQSLGILIKLWKGAPKSITDKAGRYLIKYVMP